MSAWGGVTATYYKGEIVSGSDGQLYVCVANGAVIGKNPVGDGGANWKLAYAAPTADMVFSSTLAGPVIVDTSNGHTYRIKTTAGTLGVTQVT